MGVRSADTGHSYSIEDLAKKLKGNGTRQEDQQVIYLYGVELLAIAKFLYVLVLVLELLSTCTCNCILARWVQYKFGTMQVDNGSFFIARQHTDARY